MKPSTHLVTIRLWQEEIEEGVYEWRGSVRKGIDGDVWHFAGWQSLTTVSLADLLEETLDMEDEE